MNNVSYRRNGRVIATKGSKEESNPIDADFLHGQEKTYSQEYNNVAF